MNADKTGGQGPSKNQRKNQGLVNGLYVGSADEKPPRTIKGSEIKSLQEMLNEVVHEKKISWKEREFHSRDKESTQER